MNRSSRKSWPSQALWLALAVLLPAAALPASEPDPVPPLALQVGQLWQARPQLLELRLLAAPLTALDLRIEAGQAGSDSAAERPLQATLLQLELRPGLLRFLAPAGHVAELVDGQARLAHELQLRVGERHLGIEQPRLQPRLRTNGQQGPGVAFELRDADDAVWLELRNAHHQLDLDSGALEFRNMGVVVGPELARRLGEPRLAGTAIAMARLEATVTLQPGRTLLPSSCAQPNWPTPGNPGDVALVDLNGFQVMRTQGADGPGGNDGRVVLAPSADLKNVGTREMPWYAKFSGSLPPYGNDQHPFLVWNTYRMDADGALVQYGRSGLKHAFATINFNCNCPDSQILGLQCEDTYDAFTNDVPFDEPCPGHESCTLGPRHELVPALGIWGRCGSIYDQNCDGSPADTQPYGPYDHRLVALESDFDPAAHPGSQQWFEGWYVVRDDADIYNSMGSRSIVPQWLGNSWNFQQQAGPYVGGPVIERWLAAAPAPLAAMSAELGNSEGRARLAVRVTQLPGGRYRYHYALMNFDFMRAQLAGSAPNISIVRSRGFDRLRLLAGATAFAAAVFRDGDRLPGNDWSVLASAAQVEWTAPAGAHLPWGTLYSFSFDSSGPPVPGQAEVGIDEPGTPAALAVAILVPGAELFADGFED